MIKTFGTNKRTSCLSELLPCPTLPRNPKIAKSVHFQSRGGHAPRAGAASQGAHSPGSLGLSISVLCVVIDIRENHTEAERV